MSSSDKATDRMVSNTVALISFVATTLHFLQQILGIQ